ncbi:MAG: hypothetical protein K6B68_01865 [Eubacterium sp.]|nr:hypothetical protein [Eubacterium sp.]
MINRLRKEITKTVKSNTRCLTLPDDEYTIMKYPKAIPLMAFNVKRYQLDGFGHLMLMHTRTKMGMELLTLSFMPNTCVNLPYLLVDAMSMKKKKCVFIEYYGCGNDNLNDARLQNVFDEYKSLPDYEEKENWYIKERMPYSLIKSGEESELIEMATKSVEAYLASVKGAEVDAEYGEKLKAFRERMIVEGNPSSTTLKLLLKEDGARKFMEEIIMPI